MAISGAVQTWFNSLPLAARVAAKANIEAVAEEVAGRQVQFLCGAGMSRASGYPLGADLARRFVRDLVFDRSTGDDDPLLQRIASSFPLEAISEAYSKERGASRLNQRLREAFEDRTAVPHAGHDALAFLANHDYITKIYTTNFDLLIEKAIGERALPITDDDADISKYQKMMRANPEELFPVLHIHGTVDSKSLILESATYRFESPTAKLMVADMVTETFVWVGYSLADLDFRILYFELRDLVKRFGIDRKPFVVHPLSSTGEAADQEYRIADLVWKSRDCIFIPGSAELFLPALKQQVRRQQGERWVIRLVEVSGGDPRSREQIELKWSELQKTADDNGADLLNTVEIIARREGVSI